MHCMEQEQRSRHTFFQLPYLRLNLERVVFEENAWHLESQLLRHVDQSWDHGEAAASATPSIRGELHLDWLFTGESVAIDVVAQLRGKKRIPMMWTESREVPQTQRSHLARTTSCSPGSSTQVCSSCWSVELDCL